MHAVDGSKDFDFLIGDWTVQHRRLVGRLVGSNEWQVFGGRAQVRKLMDGQANVDDNEVDIPSGPYRAVSLRCFDPASGQWAIWWLDGRHPHQVDVPVKGAFRDGVGTFLADDTLDGRPIRVRFLWRDTDTPAPLWEQAFSPDGGATWETNWTMRFVRG